MKLVLRHLLWMLISTFAVYALMGPRQGLSFGIGYFLLFGNLSILTLVWSIAIRKNLVALSFLIIVFKYAILAGAVYWILELPGIQVFWVFLGILNFVLVTTFLGIVLVKTDSAVA